MYWSSDSLPSKFPSTNHAGSFPVEEMFDSGNSDNCDTESMRKFLYGVVHSSIMRLNEFSFSKLFEICLSTVKFQVINCISGSEMVEITLNHLGALKDMVSEKEVSIISDVVIKMQDTCTLMST